MSINTFKLGNKLRDTVTGLEGIAVGKLEYLNGCIQYGIKQKVNNDGKVPDIEWIDSQQLEQVDGGVSVKQRVTGGFSKDAPRI